MGGCACTSSVGIPEQEISQVVEAPPVSNRLLIHDRQTSIRDAYIVDEDKLGKGAYGVVHRAMSLESGKRRAVKSLSKRSAKRAQRCQMEVDVMKSLHHPNLVKLIERFDGDKKMHLVLELCEGGELSFRVAVGSCFAEQEAVLVVQQMLRGLIYLHARHIVHRDLKPDNMMFLYDAPVQDNVLKIIDFGLATKCGDKDVLTTKAGTLDYVAPQVLSGKGYNKQCDVWSVGVVTFLLCCGYPPFMAASDLGILQNVQKGVFAYHPKYWSRVSKEAKSFVSSLLCVDPVARPTSEKALGYKWVTCLPASHTSKKASVPDGLVEKMRRYISKDKFSKAVDHVIARLLDDAQVSDLRRAFEAMDMDGDGQLSSAELREGVRNCGLPEHEVTIIFEGMDVNGNGTIEYTEFLAATMDKSQCMDTWVCRHAFDIFDWDGDGQISPRDLVFVLHNGQMSKAAGAESRAMVEVFDADGDGSINYAEFLYILHQ